MWVSSVLLLSHNIKRLGKPLFFSLTILPIIAFYIVFISAYDELYQISSTISKTETNLIIMLIIIFLGTSCGILYGIGFKSIASRIKSSLDVKDYMILLLLWNNIIFYCRKFDCCCCWISSFWNFEHNNYFNSIDFHTCGAFKFCDCGGS